MQEQPGFDKKSIIAFLLMGLIILVWTQFFAPKPNQKETNAAVAEKKIDTTVTKNNDANNSANTTATSSNLPSDLQAFTNGANQNLVINSPLYKATLSSKGALLSRFELTKYNTWYGQPVQLICDSANFAGVLDVDILNNSNFVNTKDFNFTFDKTSEIKLSENDSVVVTARLIPQASTDSTKPTAKLDVEKQFVFYGNKYGIGLKIKSANGHKLNWKNSLNYPEYNSVDESGRAHAVVQHDEKTIKRFDVTKPDEPLHDSIAGNIEWAGANVKYFGYAMIPSKTAQAKVSVNGNSRHLNESGMIKRYDISLQNNNANADYTVFIGPLESDLVKSYGIGKLINYGWEWLTRPIAEFFMLPLFRLIHNFVSNWGLVLIIFGLIIKTLMFPLGLPQMRSAQKMKLLAPIMEQNKAKITDDPQKLQMENAKVYREYGINPMGGCMPMLLQLPIFSALWQTLNAAIELRQSSFLFIKDLSVADGLIPLGFNFPVLGSHISLLALLMGLSMIIQMKMTPTPSSDPNQKMMQYMMPVMMTVMFNSMPAGLNLYYLTFNIVSAAHQYLYNKFNPVKMTLEDLRKEAKNKKQGWFAQKMAEAQKIAEMQQQSQKNMNGRTPVEQKKK